MLSVGLVKLVPLIKTLIKPLGDHGILLSKKLLVIQSLVQSTRLQERPIGNVLCKEEDISVTKLLDTRKYSSWHELTCINFTFHFMLSWSFFMFLGVSWGSSKCSAPSSSWIEVGRDCKGIIRVPALPDPPASPAAAVDGEAPPSPVEAGANFSASAGAPAPRVPAPVEP